MITRRNILKLATTGAASAYLSRGLKAEEQPIVIGEINSYIEHLEEFTTPYRKGLLLATEEINQKGGVRGRQLKVMSRNDYGKEEEAIRLAHHMVKTENVAMICGTFFSNVALSLAKTALDLKVPFLASEPLSDRLTLEDGNDYTFRLRPNTYMQCKMLATEAAKLPVNKWVCIAPDYEYGHSCVQNFKNFLQKSRPDVEWQNDLFIPLFNLDRKAVKDHLYNLNCDAVFNATFTTDLSELVDVAEQNNLLAGKSVVSILSGEPEYLQKLTSPICDGWIVTGYPWDQIKTRPHQTFITTYQRRFEENPTMGSLVGYMTILAARQALQNADDLRPASVIKALSHLHFDSPLGTTQFRSMDNQSSMGTFVGRLEHQDGINQMTKWFYADGSDYWPTQNEVRRRRLQGT
ncbi:ABC transporter substrate-binding protein [Terasakiella sp. A23]|uniref:ABC transporter substrate-binding protein n=1 Tax=Terasakiella sp. FCG-A23 TaxID=3080561 RepID=UPI002955BE66|nr:ABC transporter substrate-binding protein [Terasakiella sp. A23]MDV7339256.1 ABC transporter substrate-binding protein [Terasakiella sp. A23]